MYSADHRTISVLCDDESTIISIWQRIAIDMLNRRLNIYEQMRMKSDGLWGRGERGGVGGITKSFASINKYIAIDIW